MQKMGHKLPPRGSSKKKNLHTSSSDKSENSETLLEELKHIVQQLSRQSKGTPTTEEVETTVPTTLSVTAETSQDTQNKASSNPDQSKADIGMDKLKQLLKQYYDKWADGQPERSSTKLTRRTSLEKLLSLRAAKLEELKKSALDVASRASLLYLRLKQL